MADVNNIEFYDAPIYDAQAANFDVGNFDFEGNAQYDLSGIGNFDVDNLDFIGGTGGPPPVVLDILPMPGTAIQSFEAISFRVEASVMVQRILVLVQFSQLDIYEVVHDGDAFSPAYPAGIGNAKAQIPDTDEYTFTIQRRNGWPASPRVVIVAIDQAGGMNPITEVIYAWTLV